MVGHLATCEGQGQSEGQAVVASSPLPGSGAGDYGAMKPVGWKLFFDRPGRGRGKGLGQCYGVGVVEDKCKGSKFKSERSGVQSSKMFWGIEDNLGTLYDGRERRQVSRSAWDRNMDDQAFGNLEEVIIVADLAAQTMLFWRV
jgi:hypothetical protein